MNRARVLVVDDKENFLRLFERVLGDRYSLATASDGARALGLVASERFDVVLSDIRMPGADGFEVLRAVKRKCPDTEVILMTAYASVQMAVEAMREGAYDYLAKPFDPDDAALLVARALGKKQDRERAGASRESAPRSAAAPFEGLSGLLGVSPALTEAAALLVQAAGIDITVLVTGESGTGKELAARALHGRSARRDGPFVPVNCGALPGDLVESELFGHARGAFTGADVAKPGLFEAAQGGTLFLDEVGELPLSVQVKLNRALQEKEVRRVGDTRSVRVSVRVVAATHRELKGEVAAGRFREDLFYRLNVFPVRMPALRERREDIGPLAAHFLEKHASAYRRPLSGFTPEALGLLAGYSFPGNVRELSNAVERAVAISAGPLVGAAALPREVREGQGIRPASGTLVQMPYREAIERSRDRVSREYLSALLQELGGNVTRAAERAGMERESLHRLLKRHGIKSEDFKRSE